MDTENNKLIFIYVTVSRGTGRKILQEAKRSGLSGGTVFLGINIFKSPILNVLSLNYEKNEIIFIVAEKSAGTLFLEKVSKEFKFHKKNHGTAFVTDVDFVCGSSCLICSDFDKNKGDERSMYQCVYIIVERGKGEDAASAAIEGGAKGATIVFARGSGVHEKSKLFNMDIEPEKEIVMVVVSSETTEKVVSNVRSEMEIDKPGNGIIFIQNLSQVYGVLE